MKIIFKKDVSVSHSVACLYISSGILVFLGEPVFICNRPILKIYLAKSVLQVSVWSGRPEGFESNTVGQNSQWITLCYEWSGWEQSFCPPSWTAQDPVNQPEIGQKTSNQVDIERYFRLCDVSKWEVQYFRPCSTRFHLKFIHSVDSI